MSAGIEAQLKAGAQGGGFFGALGAILAFLPGETQPQYVFWYRVFGVLSAVTSVSCLFLVGRHRLARWAAIGSLAAFGGFLVAVAVVWAKQNYIAALVALVCALMCHRGLKFLLTPRIRDYFNTDY
jgi:hypothetical protein